MTSLKSIIIPLCFLVCNVFSSHFRGGTISWKYEGNGTQVVFKYRLNWYINQGSGGSWTAQNLATNATTYLGPINYTITANNSFEYWEEGNGFILTSLPSKGPFKVYYRGGAWISLGYGYGGDWNLQTIVDLHQRSDTKRPNYSPIATSRAIYRVQYGCFARIKIPTADGDGDKVKCRWSTKEEADSIAHLLPNANLDQDNCTISFTATASNNYTNNQWFAVALTIEDFPLTTMMMNGRKYTPNIPITQIPLQFLIKTENMSGTCNEKPEITSPTPEENSRIEIKAGKQLHTQVYVKSNSGLSSIDLTAPYGVKKSGILPDTLGRPDVWMIDVTWTPTIFDKGNHIICASAVDVNKKPSETRCFKVTAWGFSIPYLTSILDPYRIPELKLSGRYGGLRLILDIDECISSPCQNGGSCQGLTAAFKCNCDHGFTGLNCEIDIDECASSPCQHLGTCTDRVNGYNCSCIKGFSGDSCEIDIDECSSSPCQNGERCQDLTAAFKCNCNDGFTGLHCEIDLDECQSNPCWNNGTCIDGNNRYTCTCLSGYTGDKCQIDIDECESQPCSNNATCVDGVISWNCVCQPGFTGIHCQDDIDECRSSPCLNNGSCENQINGYSCSCSNETTGLHCETRLHLCSSAPCLNNGVCTSHLDGFSCACPNPWFGDICQNREVNKTETCTDLEYTDCSCYTTTLKPIKTKSYKMLSGLIGVSVGFWSIVIAYFIWYILNKYTGRNKVNDSGKASTANSENNTAEKKSEIEEEQNKETSDKEKHLGCRCFVDHTGFDHFKRFDERLNYKFRFHKHKGDCRLAMSNAATSSDSTNILSEC